MLTLTIDIINNFQEIIFDAPRFRKAKEMPTSTGNSLLVPLANSRGFLLEDDMSLQKSHFSWFRFQTTPVMGRNGSILLWIIAVSQIGLCGCMWYLLKAVELFFQEIICVHM